MFAFQIVFVIGVEFVFKDSDSFFCFKILITHDFNSLKHPPLNIFKLFHREKIS
jgi:hypothetical protein